MGIPDSDSEKALKRALSYRKRMGKLRRYLVTPRARAETVTLTYNELYRALNNPEGFILALVELERTNARQPRYVRNYPFREPDPLASSVKFNLRDMLISVR